MAPVIRHAAKRRGIKARRDVKQSRFTLGFSPATVASAAEADISDPPLAGVRLGDIVNPFESLRIGPQHEERNPHQHREMPDCGADGLALR